MTRTPTRARSVLRRAVAAFALLVVATPMALHAAQPARADVDPAAGSGRWQLAGWTTSPEDRTDQGLATTTASGRPVVLTRGDDSIPAGLRAAGWRHVGDPDARGGELLDAYQGSPSMRAKLFVLTTADGRQHLLLHRLDAGEQFNNSFAAIAPGGRWFVSGEWGTMRRFLVFALPAKPALRTDQQALPTSGVISLDRPVRNVQGCAFSSATTLQCSTNDPGRDLFGVARQLLTVRLAHPLNGTPVSAKVSLLGPVPAVEACGQPMEVEGIDVHGSRMLVSVVSGCRTTTTTFRYVLVEPPYRHRPTATGSGTVEACVSRRTTSVADGRGTAARAGGCADVPASR